MGLMLTLWLLLAQAPIEGVHVAQKMETATALEIEPDGRYRWFYSQGALDLTSEGSWIREGDRITLTSDPFSPPRFDFAGRREGKGATLGVEVATGRGDPIPAVDVLLRYRSGREVSSHTDAEGRLEATLPSGETLEAVTLSIAAFELRSEPFKLSAKAGEVLSFRFEPNDLGKQAFNRESVLVTKTGLLLKFRNEQLDYERQEGGLEEVP
jgi:hypothetical protein